ncbi:MAG: M23 family metallopeptidase [Bacteroidota bacterium]
MQNKQQLLLKTWKAIANEKKIDYLVSRKSTIPKSSPYIIKEVDKKDYRNTALVELENYLGQIENYLAKESEEQQRLLSDLQAYKWKLDHTPSIWPVVSYITSSFGKRVHPVLKYNRKHVGIDMGAASGTKVAATAAGVVSFAGWRGGYGYAVMINHQNGFQTLYAHNSKLLVSIGQSISKGQTISLSGNTGITTGPHLHYEVYINGKPVNPVPYLKR